MHVPSGPHEHRLAANLYPVERLGPDSTGLPTGINQDGIQVCSFERTFYVYRRGAAPLAGVRPDAVDGWAATYRAGADAEEAA